MRTITVGDTSMSSATGALNTIVGGASGVVTTGMSTGASFVVGAGGADSSISRPSIQTRLATRRQTE
jgi:hypothetical protein